MTTVMTAMMDAPIEEEELVAKNDTSEPSLQKNDAVEADMFSLLSIYDIFTDTNDAITPTSKIIIGDSNEPSLQCIIETVGTSLLAYLEPKNIFLLSTVNKQYHEKTVHQWIFVTCSKHLNDAIKIGDRKNYEISFSRGRSFYQKIDPWECIFSQVTSSVGLLDIFRRAYDQEKFTICEALYLQKDRPPKKEDDERRSETLITVLCNLHDQNSAVAQGLARYIMNRDAIQNGYGNEKYDFVWDWLDYLIKLKVSLSLAFLLAMWCFFILLCTTH